MMVTCIMPSASLRHTFLLLSAILSTVRATNYGLHLTVSSKNQNAIELNWYNECANDLEWIGLYDGKPISPGESNLIMQIVPRNHPYGYFVTDIKVNNSMLPGKWNRYDSLTDHTNGSICFDFWIGGHSKNKLVESNCLKIQPTWMNDNKDKLSGTPIGKILIPGTHNSGCFRNTPIYNRLDDLTLTQSTDVYTQLVYGIRYLDLRVGYYTPEGNKSTERLWVNHDVIKIRPLKEFLLEIKDFVKKSPGEIIILDIHRLPIGFQQPNGAPYVLRHKELIELVLSELGDYAINYMELRETFAKTNLYLVDGPRMKDLWNTNKQILICYPNLNISREYRILWPPLKQMWGDVHLAKNLKPYIQRVLNGNIPVNPGNPLWAIMAELTPSPLDIILNPVLNLRSMADSINRNLTRWVEDEWWKKSNIYATDFFLGNDLIEVSVNSIELKTTVNINNEETKRKLLSKC